MSEYPTVAILLMSYGFSPEHTGYCLRTIESLKYDLRYEGNFAWYVASNCGNEKHHAAVMASLNGQHILGHHNKKSTCGKSWNRGLIDIYQRHGLEYVMVMEEDWELKEPFDITRYVKVMTDFEKIGMIRFGTLTVGMKMMVVGYNGYHYLRMDKSCQYAYSGNPHLRHKRLNAAVGLYDENIHPSPGDVEIDFDTRFRRQDQVDIIRPADLPGWGIFQHFGSVQSYEG